MTLNTTGTDREALLQAEAERDEARSRLAAVAAVVETWADVDLDEATGEDLFQLWEAVNLALASQQEMGR